VGGPLKWALRASVTKAKTLRCCWRQVSITLNSVSTKRLSEALCVPKRKEKGISPIFVLLKDRHSVIAPIQDMKNQPPRRDASSAWHAATLSRPVRLVNNWTYPLSFPFPFLSSATSC